MIINRHLLVLPALIALAARHVEAFTPSFLGSRSAVNTCARFSMVASQTDVSVEYDAAARLAYKDWCAKFGKDSSESKFTNFKSNYETITVANVSAAKQARDSGEARPRDLELNEFGDMTEEEYMQMKAGGAAADLDTDSEKGALESVLEASAAQSDASTALAEAADALAEEEEELARALGLNSVDQLEEAIDALEGFDSDGGAIDTSDVREARVRSAYLDWCKEYGKQPDESRFPTFSSNFLAMEEYAKENGREMVMNKYADCTEEEYRRLTNTQAPAPELVVETEPSVPELVVETEPSVPELVLETKPSAPELVMKTEPPVSKKEEPKAVTEVPKVPISEVIEKPKPVVKAPPEPKPVIELSLEEQAIALAKSTAEAEAVQIAKRRALDEEAAQKEREKAKEALKKQQQLQGSITAFTPKPPKTQPNEDKAINSSSLKPPINVEIPFLKLPKASVKEEKVQTQASLKTSVSAVPKQTEDKVSKASTKPTVPAVKESQNVFASVFGSQKKSSDRAMPVKATTAAPAKVTTLAAPAQSDKATDAIKVPIKELKKDESLSPFTLFKLLKEEPRTKSEPVIPDIASTKVLVKEVKKSERSSPFSLFKSVKEGTETKTKPVAPAAVSTKALVKEVKKNDVSSPFAIFKSVKDDQKIKPQPVAPTVPPKKPVQGIDMSSNAMTGALNSFFGLGKESSNPVVPPTPKMKVSEELNKPRAQPYNLFGGASSLKKKVENEPNLPDVSPVRKPSPTLSLFKTSTPKVTPASITPVSTKGSGTFSLFPFPTSPQTASIPSPKQIVEKKPTSTFGAFFGGSAPPKSASPPPSQSVQSADKTSVKRAGTIRLFGGSSIPSKSPSSVVKPPPVQSQPIQKLSPLKKSTSSTGIAGIGGLSSFSSPKKAAKPQGTQIRGPGTFSISSIPKPVTSVNAPTKKSPTISLFSGSISTPSKSVGTKAIGAPKVMAESLKPAAKKSPTLSLFSGTAAQVKSKEDVKKAATPKVVVDNIPIIGKFKQNSDGSITGIVRNSKNFQNGTEITTSPVRRGAKAGDVVTTSSGSKYKLE